VRASCRLRWSYGDARREIGFGRRWSAALQLEPSRETETRADGNLLIWALSEEKTATAAFGEDPNEAQYAKEVWKIKRACRVTPNEIYDLAWSPDGQWILCGSTDNVARFYNANDGSCHAQISDHANYVQGVSWDPLNQFVATQSSDR
jgi:chromatin assembly factor 1 subunit B